MFNKILLLFILCSPPIVGYSSTPIKKNQPKKSTSQLDLIRHETVNSGDHLYGLLKKQGFPSAAANRLIANKPHLKKFSLSPGHKYTVVKKNEVLKVNLYGDLGKKHVFWYSYLTQKFGYKNINDGLTVKKQTIYGKVKGSLFGSIGKYIKDPLVPYKFRDTFLLHYNLKKIVQPNAKFSFTIERKYHGQKFIKYGLILNSSLEINGQMVHRTLIRHDQGYSYVGQKDNKTRPFYSPVDYMHFASLYQKRRFHPVRKRYMAHKGVDFALPSGKPIYAVSAGKVIKKGYSRGAGNYLSIRHSGGLISYYNHLSKHSSKIKKGQWVRPGKIIGWNGCTGSCTKPHLHFAVKKNGRFVNPVQYLKSYPFHAKKGIKVL